jgi:hypothetical protein
MAYRSVYKKKVRVGSKGIESSYTVLEAFFNFRKEVARGKRDIIRKRIGDLFSEPGRIGIPERFFIEGPLWEDSYHYMKKGRLSFNLYVDTTRAANSHVVDLDAMNDYILTGKMKEI